MRGSTDSDTSPAHSLFTQLCVEHLQSIGKGVVAPVPEVPMFSREPSPEPEVEIRHRYPRTNRDTNDTDDFSDDSYDSTQLASSDEGEGNLSDDSLPYDSDSGTEVGGGLADYTRKPLALNLGRMPRGSATDYSFGTTMDATDEMPQEDDVSNGTMVETYAQDATNDMLRADDSTGTINTEDDQHDDGDNLQTAVSPAVSPPRAAIKLPALPHQPASASVSSSASSSSSAHSPSPVPQLAVRVLRSAKKAQAPPNLQKPLHRQKTKHHRRFISLASEVVWDYAILSRLVKKSIAKAAYHLCNRLLSAVHQVKVDEGKVLPTIRLLKKALRICSCFLPVDSNDRRMALLSDENFTPSHGLSRAMWLVLSESVPGFRRSFEAQLMEGANRHLNDFLNFGDRRYLSLLWRLGGRPRAMQSI